MNETRLLAQDLIRCGADSLTTILRLKEVLEAAHFSAEIFTDENGTANLWAKFGETGPLFVYSGHTDVVATGPISEWRAPPFSGEMLDGQIYGRGISDMRGGVAAFTIAAIKFLAENPRPNFQIGFLIAGDEETKSRGTEFVMEQLSKRGIQVASCLVGEPTSEEKLGDFVKTGRRGSVTCKLTIFGTQGHAAYPELADNAIHAGLDLLQKIAALQIVSDDPRWPVSSYQIVKINADGQATNIIPGSVELTINCRYPGSFTREQVVETLDAACRGSGVKYTLEAVGKGMVSYVSVEGDLLREVKSAVEETVGITPQVSFEGGGSDGRFIAPLGIEVVEFGPRNKTIHQVNERLPVAELLELEKVYLTLLSRLNGIYS